ncbi:hypothetical protein PENSPDRAFT_758252 [Peniophora sp. CONT]|nr:hypothetical protein PENSPDRAFT_758252 [Peniophora sp. CONT]
MDQHRAASREAWATFLRSRFDTCARAGFTSVAVKRADLADLELEVMEERVVFARQQRNKIVGACRLPPEVLSKVFAHAQEIWSPKYGKHPVIRASYSSGWMSLLHVCSFWRQTALGSPSLWCNLPCMDIHPDSVPTLLARSRGLPLSLRISGPSLPAEYDEDLHVDPFGHWLCKAVLRRTKHLFLDKVPDYHLQQCLGNLRHPTPLLEVFKITDPQRQERNIEATLPMQLFGGHAPVLRSASVTATNLPVDWDCALFSVNLVHLSLGFDSEHTPQAIIMASAPSIVSFYKTISSMKNLESLTLRDVFPDLPRENQPRDDHPPAATVRVELSNLKRLTLAASSDLVESCVDFFQRLSFPSQSGVILDIDAEGDDFNFDDRLPMYMVKLFGPADAATPSSMCLSQVAVAMEYSDAPSIQTRLRHKIPSCSPGHEWKEYNLGVGARGLWTRHWDMEDFTVLSHLSLLPLCTLQTIIFTSDVSRLLLSPEAWVSTFIAAHNVQGISVHYHDALVLLDALSETSWGSSTNPFALFPRLSTIAIHADTNEKRPVETTAEMRTSLDVLLLDMLQVRKEKAVPVETLLVSQALAGWDVWDRVGDLAHVEFF